MGILSQLGLLLGKDVTLLVRQPAVLTFQCLWPLTLVLIVAVVRQAMPPEAKPTCSYPSRSMPSSGVMNFMQSFVCNINNKCTNTDDSAAKAAQAGARISNLFKNLEPLAKANGSSGSLLQKLPKSLEALDGMKEVFNKPEVKRFLNTSLQLGNFFKDRDKVKQILVYDMKVLDAQTVDALLNASINLQELYNLIGYIDFKGIACNETRLKQYLIFSKEADVQKVALQLCRIKDDKIPDLVDQVQHQIDVKFIFQVASRIAGFVGEYDISAAFDDIASMFDSVLTFDIMKDVTNVVPTIVKISSMLRRTGQMIEDIVGKNMSEVNATFAIFGTVMNQLDPLVSSIIQETMPNSTIWIDIKDVFYKVKHIFDIVSVIFKQTPNVKLTFGGILKNATSVEDMLSKWLTVEGPEVISTLINAQVDQTKLNVFIQAIDNASSSLVPNSQEALLRVMCDRPGITSFLITPKPDVLDKYIKERLCRLNNTAIMDELMANFDIKKIIDSFEKSKVPMNWNWTDLAESGKGLVDTVMKHWKDYEGLITVLSKIEFEKIWQGFMASDTQAGIDQLVVGIAQSVSGLQMYPDIAKSPILHQIIEMTDLMHDMLTSIIEIINSGMLYEEPMLNVAKEMAKYGPDIMTGIIEALFKPETLMLVSKDAAKLEGILCNETSARAFLGLPASMDIKQIQAQLCNSKFYDFVKRWQTKFDLTKYEKKFGEIFGPMNSTTTTTKYLSDSVMKGYEMYKMIMNISVSMDKTLIKWNQTLMTIGASFSDPKWQTVPQTLMNQMSYSSVAMVVETLGPIFENSSAWQSVGQAIKMMTLTVDLMNTQLSSTADVLLGNTTVLGKAIMYVTEYGPDMMEAIGKMMMDPAKSTKFFMQPNLTQALCDETTVRTYLAIPPRVPLKEMLQYFCTLDVQKLMNELNTGTDKVIENMISLMNTTAPPKMDWIAAVESGKRLYDTIEKMVAGTYNSNTVTMFMDIGEKAKRYETAFNNLVQMFENATQQDMLGIFTTILKSMEVMENVLPPEMWKMMKISVKVVDMFVLEINKRMEKMTKYGIRLGDMFEAPSMVRDFLNATLSMTPSMIDGIMNMILEPDKVIVTLLTNPNPCGGTFFTTMFPKANPTYVAVMEKMICYTSLDSIGKALSKEPFVVMMVNFTESITYKETMPSPPNRWNVTSIQVSNYKDIPVNFTEVGLHVFETWRIMEKLVNVTGPYLPDVPGFNLTSIELTTQKMIMKMNAMDWNKYLATITQLTPLLVNATAQNMFSLLPQGMLDTFLPMMELLNKLVPLLNDRMGILLRSNLTIESIFKDFPLHQRLVSILNYMPQITEVLITSVEPDNVQKLMNMTYPAPLDLMRTYNNLCSNDAAKYFTIPSTAVQFRYVLQTVCVILGNPEQLLNEFYRFTGVSAVREWQMLQAHTNRSEAAKAVTFAKYVSNVLEMNKVIQDLFTKLTSPGNGLIISPPLWLDGRVWQQALMNVNSSITLLQTMNTEQMEQYQLKLVAAFNPHMQTLLTATDVNGFYHAVMLTEDVLIDAVTRFIANGTLKFEDMLKGLPEMQKVTQMVGYFPQAFEILTLTMLHPTKASQFVDAINKMEVLPKICSGAQDQVLDIPSYLMADFMALKPKLCAVNTTKFMQELVTLPVADLFGPKMNESLHNKAPVNFTAFYEKSFMINRLITQLIMAPPNIDFGNLMVYNATLWSEMMMRILRQLNDPTRFSLANNVMLATWLQEMVKVDPILSKAVSVGNLVMDFLVKELYPMIGANLTLDDLISPVKYPTLAKLTKLLDYSPQIVQVLIATSTMKSGPLTALFTTPKPLQAFCAAPLDTYLAIPAGTEVAMNLVNTTVCGLDQAKIVAEFNSRIGNLSSKIEALFMDKSLAVIPQPNVTEFLTNVDLMQKILMTMITAPPQWVGYYDWMNATVWHNVLENLEKMWPNDTASIINQALAGLQQGLDSVMPMLANNTEALQGLRTTQELLNWMNNYLNQGTKWNPFSLIENTTELNKLWEIVKRMPTVLDMVLNTMTDPVKSNALVNGLMINPATYLATICQNSNWSTVFSHHLSQGQEVNKIRQELCSLNMTLLEAEVKQMAQTEFGAIINAATSNATGSFNTANLFTSINTMSNLIQKLVGETAPGKFPFAFNPNDYPLFNEQIWKTTVDRFLFEMQNKIGNDTDSIIALVGQFDWVFTTLLAQTGAASGDIQNAMEALSSLTGMFNNVVKSLMDNSFSMEVVLGQGSEIQKLTKLFNALPDITGMIMAAGMNTHQSGPFLTQLAMMNGTDDFVALCKSDWKKYLTMPKGSSINVADVQSAVCSLNITLLEQQMSTEFGSLVQLMGGSSGSKTPFSFASLIMKATQTAAITSKLIGGVNISTSSYPWADESRWMSIINDYNAQTQNVLAQILNGIEGFGSMLAATVPNQELMPAIHIMNQVMELVLTKMGDLNQTHIVLSDLFKSPELKKLFMYLDNAPYLFDVLTYSMQMPMFWNLTMEKNITVAFLKLCHPMSDVTQYFGVPAGSNANLTALKEEFCKINIATLMEEAQAEFNIQDIIAAGKNVSPANWTMTGLKFYQLYQQIDKWVKNKPEVQLPKWTNGTQWIATFTNYAASMNTSQDIFQTVMKTFVNMIPLFENDSNALAFFGVLNTMIKMANDNMKLIGPGMSITLYDIVQNVPQLKDLVKLSLNLSTDVMESALYTTFLDPAKLMAFAVANDSLAALCDPTTGLASAITVPASVKVDAQEIQRIMCSVNITTMRAEIMTGFHMNQFIMAITMATQNQIKSVNWTELLTNSAEFTTLLDNLIKNPPTFKVNLDENAFKAVFDQFMKNINLEDMKSYHKLIEVMMTALQGSDIWNQLQPVYSMGFVIAEYVNTILGRLQVTDGKLELMSLFGNADKLKDILKVTFGFSNDLANGLLSTQIKVDMIVPLMVNAIQAPDTFFKNLVCSEAQLNRYFYISPSLNATMVKNAFCGFNETAILAEIQREFNIASLMQKIAQVNNGTYNINIMNYLQASESLVAKLMTFTNVTGLTFNQIDLFKPINMTAALDKSMLQLVANLPKLEVETFTRMLEQIMPLIEKEAFWNQTKSYLILINTVADVLNKKVSSLIGSNLTLDSLLKDSTTLKTYLRKLFASAPQLVNGIMSAQVDIAKILSTNDTESLQTALCGDALKFTNVNVTAIHESLCKANLTAVIKELKLEINYDRIYAEIVTISSMQPSPTPFNLTTTILNMQTLATNFATLAATTKLPTLGQFFNYTGNMTEWEQQWLQFTSQPLQLDDALINIIGSTMESITPMLANSLGPVLPTIIKAYEFMVKLVKDRLIQFGGRPITLNTLFNNATQVQMIIQATFGLDVKTVEALLLSSVQSDKLIQLIASQDPLKSICASGLDFLTPPSGATLDLSSIQSMMCKLNITILMQQLQDEIKLSELLVLVNTTMTNPNTYVNWTSAMFESKQLIELIASLVQKPPTLDPTLLALFDLTKYSPAIMAYVNRTTQLAESMDIAGLLSQFQPLLLGALAPLQGTEAMNITLQAYQITKAILDFTNSLLSQVTVTNGQVNIGGLFKDSQRLKDIMDVTFGLGPTFVSGILSSVMSVEKLVPLVSQGPAAIPVLEKIACDEGLLKQYFTFHSTVNVMLVKQAFCGINATLLLAELEKEFSYSKLISEIQMALKSPSTNIDFASISSTIQQLMANINKFTGASGVIFNEKDLMKYFNFSANMDQTIMAFVASLPPLETATFAKILEQATAMLENTPIWRTIKGYLNVINIVVDVMNNKIKDIPASNMTIKDLFKNSPQVHKLLTSTFALTPVLLEKVNPFLAAQIQTTNDLKQFLCDAVKNSSQPSSAATICSFNETVLLQQLMMEINYPAIVAEISKIGPNYTAPFNWTTTLRNAQHLVQNFMTLANTIKLPTVQEFFMYTGNFTEWVMKLEQAGLVYANPTVDSIVASIGATLDSILPMLLPKNDTTAQEFLFVIKSYDYFVKVIKDRLVAFTGGQPITLEKILKNANRTKELLRSVLNLDAAMIEALLSSTVNTDKLFALLSQPDLDQQLCQSSNSLSQYFSLSPSVGVSIDQLQKAICNVNVTILLEELSREFDIQKFVQWSKIQGPITLNWTSTVMNSYDLVKTFMQLISSEPGVLDSSILNFLNTSQQLGPIFENWFQMMLNSSLGANNYQNIANLLETVVTMMGNSSVSQDMMKFLYGANFYLEYLNQRLTQLTTQPLTLDSLFRNMTSIRSLLEAQLKTEDVIVALNAEIKPDKLMALIQAVNNKSMTIEGALCSAADLLQLPANYTGNLKQYIKNQLCTNTTAILEELKDEFRIDELMAGLTQPKPFNFTDIVTNSDKFYKLLAQLIKVPPTVGADLQNLFNMTGLDFDVIMKELGKMDPSRLLSLVSTFGPMLNSLDQSMGGFMVMLQLQISSIVKNLEFMAAQGFDLEKFLTNSTALDTFFQNMWSTNTVENLALTFNFMIPPQFMLLSGYPVIKSLVCNEAALRKLINAPAYLDVASMSGAMCNKNGSQWVNGLLSANISQGEIINLASKLQMVLVMNATMPVLPTTPSANWVKMEGDLKKLAEIFKNVQKLPPGFIPGFNESYWKPLMEAFVKSLESGITTQTLSLLNFMDPLLRDQQFWNLMKKYMQEFATFTEYINTMLGKLQDGGKQLQLVNLFPNKDAVVNALSQNISQANIAEFLTAVVEPRKYLELLQAGNKAEEYFCNATLFSATFQYPASMDAAKLQQVMCASFKNNKLGLQQFMSLLNIESLVKEIERLTGTNPTTPMDKNPFEYFVTQIRTFVQSINLMTIFIPGDTSAEFQKYFRTIETALAVMLQQSSTNFGRMCDATQALLNEAWFKEARPFDVTIQLGMEVASDLLKGLVGLEPEICTAQGSSITNVLRKFADMNIVQSITKVMKVFNGEITESFQCSRSINAGNSIYETFDKLLLNGVQNNQKITKCVEDFFTKNFASIKDVQGFFSLMLEFQTVINEDLFNTNSSEVGAIIDAVISGILRQQPVAMKIMDIFKKDMNITDTLLNIAKVTPEMVNIILQSTINLDVSKFENISDAEMKAIFCSPAELSKHINVPAVFKLDFVVLSSQLCSAAQNFSISQLRNGLNLAKIAIVIGGSNNPGVVASDWLDEIVVHISDIVRYGSSLFELVDMVMPFDIDKIIKMLPKIQELMLDGTPEKIFDSLVALIREFEVFATTPETKQLVKDVAKFANGLRDLKLFKFMFNVRMSDLIKDDEAFANYLIKEIGMTPDVTKALLNSSFSFLEMELVVKKNITAYFCDPVKLTKLMTLDKASTVKASDITSALCSMNANKTAEVMEKLIVELDIGELIKTYVTMTADQLFKEGNVSMDGIKDTMEKLKPLTDQLEKYLQELSEFTKALPSIPGKASGQVSPGGPATAKQTAPESEPESSGVMSMMSEMLCGSPDAMSFKDEFGIADSIGETDTSSPQYQKELNELPGQSCAEIYKTIRSMPGGSIIWAYIKPLMLGKIPYSPDTPMTRQIMKQANATFEELGDLKMMLEEFVKQGGGLNAITNNTENINTLKDALTNPFVSGAIEEALGMKGDELIKMMESFSLVQTDDLEKMLYYSSMMLNYTDCVDLDRYVGVKDEKELEKVSAELGRNRKVMAALVFIDGTSNRKKRAASPNGTADVMPKHVKYKIRVDIDNTPAVYLKYQEYSKSGPGDDFASDLRYMRAFVPLQDMVDKAIISAQVGKTIATPSLKVKQFPYPCYNSDSFLNYFTYLLPLLMVLAWFVQIAVMIRAIVSERETGLCETLRVMGMSSVVNFLSWFFTTMISQVIMSILIIVILKLSNLLPYSSWLLMILLLVAFSFSTTMLCYLISAFFTRASLASMAGIIVYMFGYLPWTFHEALGMTGRYNEAYYFSLLSPSAFSFAAGYVSRYEEMGVGIQWDNIYDVYPGEIITFSWACIMMVIDGAIYFIIGWYVRNVFPGKFGMPQPFYFPFLPRYWGCFCCTKKDQAAKYTIKNAYRNPVYEDNEAVKTAYHLKKTDREFTPMASTSSTLASKIGQYLCYNVCCPTAQNMCCPTQKKKKYTLNTNAPRFNGTHFKTEDPESFLNESEPVHLPVGISIHHLTKKYKKKKVAVNNLSMNFYEGQITALLGQNGAGKTTTINMLCGIFPPSSGSAYINGKSIWTEYSQIRKTLGYCPQHNVLFDSMTVKEHMKFFGKLKGILSAKKLKADISSLLDSMGLRHFKNEKVRNLSGGMKRRLSVAIAFVGGSRVVILDEPTAGVDPAARRNIWDLIAKHKEGRTILLTTHHLDEADILADRIAVMHQGKLLCTGSSMFLKNRFGRGYLLTISKSKVDPDASADSVKSFDSGAVMEFISRELPGAYIEEEVGSEVRVLLPISQRETYHKFFSLLNTFTNDLMISSYGVSDTTLEEVFLSLCHLADNGKQLTRENVDEMHHQHSMKQTNGTSPDNGVMSLSIEEPPAPVNGAQPPEGANGTNGINGVNGISGTDGINGTSTQQRKKTVFKVGGIALKFIQFWSLFVKRFHHHRRFLRGFITYLILPCLFIAFAMWTNTVSPGVGDSGSRQMTPALYGGNVFYKNSNPINFNKLMSESLLGPPGISTNCMPGFRSLPNVWYRDRQRKEELASREIAVCLNQTVSPPFTTPILTQAQKDQYKNPPSCKCDGARQVCPAYAEGYPPPRKTMNSSETMFKLDSYNITDWILRTYQDFPNDRFGGWEFGNTQSAAAQDQTATVWFNNRGIHSLPSYVNGLSNAVQRKYAKEILGQDPSEYGITVYNHPLPLTTEQLSAETILQRASHLGTSIVILVAFCFIPASLIIYPVAENLNQEKRLQFVYGIGPVLYWLTSIFWDMLMFAIPVGVAAGIMYGFDIPIYVARQNLQASVVLMILFGWAATPFCYMMVRTFKDASSAFMTSFILLLFIGITLTLCTFLLGTFVTASPIVKTALYYIEYIFLASPSFALGDGFIKLARNQILADIFEPYNEDVYKSPFSFEMLGWHFVALGIQGVVFLLITIWMETTCECCSNGSRSVTHGDEEDDDVVQETKRVMTGGAKDDMLVVKGLSKYYRSGMHSVRAVDHVSLGIPRGDCFGLLGLNGAGKTTTFKMLTGEVPPSSGKARLFRKNITHCTSNLSSNVGYCPQFDALDRQLTGGELLRCYTRLKGISGPDADRVIKDLVNMLHLQDCVKKVVSTYSGGMRRRLSIAIAMIGDPQLVLLDEPTAGMDPQMRRYVWNALMDVIHDDRSIVFTSHKMDECEFLCTRIAIMVNGQFRCLGSPQHLRSKFGEGYTLTVRLSEKASPLEVTEFVQSRFPGAVLKDQHFQLLVFNIPSNMSQLPNIFALMEDERHILGVEDYSVNQTTLDQVFVNFSQDQDDGVIDDDSQSDIETKQNDVFQSAAFDNSLYATNSRPMRGMEYNDPKGYENQMYDNMSASQYDKNITGHSGIVLDEKSTKL
ncbi:uncharacterized protein LOC135492321 isoform X3 [Lineus longissimus]|uniref:uncharacterized protein LOC135492321 isoform X3 n=1 Tax=Lineus longissimus TaxID=88925 RepID=UPI00315DBB97